jgi:hypothetical protein
MSVMTARAQQNVLGYTDVVADDDRLEVKDP